MSIVLIAIIAITALVSFQGFNDLSFFRKYEFHIGSIRAGEQYRMISSGFLHADVVHLAFNMMTLWFFAPIVSAKLSEFWLALIYMGSLVFGSLFTVYFHRNEYHYRAIGASGAVMGVLYSAILFNPDMKIGLFILPPVIPAWIFGMLYLGYSIYGMKTRRDNIGHTAHFGGAVGGYVLTLIKAPELFLLETHTVILMALPIVLLFALEKTGKL